MSQAAVDGQPVPTLEAIQQLAVALEPHICKTPVFDRDVLSDLRGTRLNFKFELLLQASGTFKARGAFSNMLALGDEQRRAGVTCVSAGNHAVAVAYAAMRLGTVLGTATLGLEWARQAPALDAVILPIGGGGLAAGVATAFKLVQPGCKVYGVEPEGADVMARSFQAGQPLKMGPMQGIADSLMAPHTESYSFELCRRSIDRLVTVSDDQVRSAMLHLFEELKLSPEPACAAASAGLLGPLRAELEGKRVGVLLCGTNTDLPTLTRHLDAARALA